MSIVRRCEWCRSFLKDEYMERVPVKVNRWKTADAFFCKKTECLIAYGNDPVLGEKLFGEETWEAHHALD